MLSVHDEHGVAVITIDRPEKANSLPQEAKAQLAVLIEQAAADRDVEAIVITGAGERSFCAGSDVSQMSTFSMDAMDQMLTSERAMYVAPLRASKPVVAAVNGYALGAGLILAMCCDYTVSSVKAKFGTPELTIGVAAPLEGLLLPYLVGLGRARGMFYTGAKIDAKSALGYGLVNEIVGPTSVLPRAVEVAKNFAALPATGFQVHKRLLYHLISTGNLECAIQESHHQTSRQFADSAVQDALRARFPDSVDSLSNRPERVSDDERRWLQEEAKRIVARGQSLSADGSLGASDFPRTQGAPE